MRFLAKTMMLGVALAMQTTTASALDEIKGSDFQMLKDVSLNEAGDRELNNFRNAKSGFGSMYVSPDGVFGAWKAEMFSLADAQKLTKTICELQAKAPCIEIARFVPRNSVGETAIPKRAQSDFRTATRKTGSGRFAAFATHGLGGWGFASDFTDLSEAHARAILECKASSARDRAKHDKDRRQAFERAGFYDCAIIHTIQKK